MKAFAIDRFGDEGSIHELPTPTASGSEVLVRVVAAGVNPIDWKIRDGMRGNYSFPLVLGQDFAGLVVATGPLVKRYAIDDRIFGTARKHGAFADYTVVPEVSADDPSAKIPDAVGDADAAALPTSGLTALASLDALGVGKDTLLLINGAIGGVGSVASQIAHARGATVVGTVHSGKEEYARSLGIDDVILYDRENVVDSLARRYPNGVDALLDVVSDADTLKRIGAAVRKGGTVVSTIYVADVAWFASRGVTAIDIVLNQTPESSHHGLRELVKLVEDGSVRVNISEEYALSDAAVALQRGKSGNADGKIVLTTEMVDEPA